MEPVEFEHQNTTFAKNQPQYKPLPALVIEGPEGHIVSCWKLSIRERVHVLFYGRVWSSMMTFNKPLTPFFLAVNRKEVYSHPEDSVKWYQKLTLKKIINYEK